MKIRFFPGSVFFLLLLLTCAAANSIHSNPLLLLAGILFGPLLWNFLIPFPILRRMEVKRNLPECVFAREDFPCEIELVSHSRSGFSCTSIHPFPDIPLLFHLEKVQEFTPRKNETHRLLNYTLEIRSRGIFEPKNVQISCSYPFGLFSWSRTFQTSSVSLTVFPERIDTKAFWEQAVMPNAAEGIRSIDGDFAGLRLWTEGEPLRRIHWRASARHGQLLAAKQDGPQPLSVFLIADLTDPNRRNAEKSISLTASLIWDLCRDLAPFTFGAETAIWLMLVDGEKNELLKSEETEDFCRLALEKLARFQPREGNLPKTDPSSEIEEFRQTHPSPNILWIGQDLPEK